MMKIFYCMLFLATPSLVHSQSNFQFKPEVTTVQSNVVQGIKLATFTTTVLNGAMVLEWKPATETNNRNFIIERSLDGVSFDVVGEMTAMTIGGHIDYSFTDEGILHTNTFYRLRHLDAHGKSVYSETISVSLARERKKEAAVRPSPNKGTYSTQVSTSSALVD